MAENSIQPPLSRFRRFWDCAQSFGLQLRLSPAKDSKSKKSTMDNFFADDDSNRHMQQTYIGIAVLVIANQDFTEAIEP